MEIIGLILAMSAIMWYIIDRAKGLWSEVSFGKYITIGLSAVFAFGLTFSFGMDIIFASGLFSTVTLAGQILTGFVLMSGSSAVAEVIERVKGGSQIITDTRDSNLDE